MANRKNKKKMAPVYSADTLALRFVLGLLLVALGVCIFLATDLGMGDRQGGIFALIDDFFCGLFGGMNFVAPFMFAWAGILVIMSSQRQVHPKPFFWAILVFFGICTMINLCTRYGTEKMFENFSRTGISDWSTAIVRTHAVSSVGAAGGSFGALLGWPMYQILGTFLSCVLVVLGTLAALLMAVGMTPSRIRELIAKQQGRQPDPRDERKRIAWQQEQEQQRIMAAQQQAEYARQQQMMMQQYQDQPGAYINNGNAYNGVEQFTDETTTRLAAGRQRGTNRSVILGQGPARTATAEERPERKSRIFGRKEKADGLSDTPASEKYAAGRSAAVSQNTGRTQPQQTFTRPSYAEQVADRQRYQRPEQEPKQKTAPVPPIVEEEELQPVPAEGRKRYRAEEPEQPANDGPTATLRKTEHRKPRTEVPPETAPVLPVADELPEKPQTVDKPVRRTEPKEERKVPEVQMTVGVASYQPDLKLPPKEADEKEPEEEYWEPTPYNYPRITLLKQPVQPEGNNEEEDVRRARKLEETLAAFKVQARVVNVTHGPAISRFELELATGIKVNKVLELERDIACGMEATSVRIEAPIPGKSLVGVEVPNPKTTTVTLREVLESDPMQNAKSILTVALGRDIAGTPIVCDLAKMPHLLIAGATGSGKSVCINTVINSILYRASPDEVKLILIDPKVVELKCYNGIPHLLIPVVNEPRKAATALAWAVAEMMERYDKFAKSGVRNLEGYNDQLKPNQKPMPRIVVIIDELADLMMTCKKDVEDYICRLTQLARAAGIHLIVATQRPSVDVITGLIKANIPSRIAFKTASYVDSRTILDRNGSEQLLGWGDMLYLPTGSFAPTRIQGCFVSDQEVQAVTDEVRRYNPSTYDPNVLDRLEQLGQEKEAPQTMDMIGGAQDSGDVDSDLFEQCVEMAIQDGQISTSTLQRRLKIGYSRAGRLTDQLEERGIISAKDGSKPRKCLITREEWEEIRNSTEDM